MVVWCVRGCVTGERGRHPAHARSAAAAGATPAANQKGPRPQHPHTYHPHTYPHTAIQPAGGRGSFLITSDKTSLTAWMRRIAGFFTLPLASAILIAPLLASSGDRFAPVWIDKWVVDGGVSGLHRRVRGMSVTRPPFRSISNRSLMTGRDDA